MEPFHFLRISNRSGTEYRWNSGNLSRLRFLQSVNMNVILRNVSFRYPGSEKYALRDISFRVERGQLCVNYFTLYA